MIRKTVEYYTIAELKARAEEEGHKTSGCLKCKNAYEKAMDDIRNEYIADSFGLDFSERVIDTVTKAGFDYKELTTDEDVHYNLGHSQGDYVHVCTQNNEAVNLSREVLKAIGYEQWEKHVGGIYITRKQSHGFYHVVTFELHEDDVTKTLSEEELDGLEDFLKAKFKEIDSECLSIGLNLMMPSDETLFEYTC